MPFFLINVVYTLICLATRARLDRERDIFLYISAARARHHRAGLHPKAKSLNEATLVGFLVCCVLFNLFVVVWSLNLLRKWTLERSQPEGAVSVACCMSEIDAICALAEKNTASIREGDQRGGSSARVRTRQKPT